ncbi:MAG: AmmeMemoRadiSam system protein B [Candidatus Falkowbacteria bacterium]
MPKQIKILLVLISLLAVAQAGLLIAAQVESVDKKMPASDLSALGKIASSTEKILPTNNKSDRVYGGILPHHLMVKDYIVAYLNNLPDVEYDTVVLIGPNHFEKGEAIISTKRNWETENGTLESASGTIEKLGLKINDAPFKNEHSIGGLVSLIKKRLPSAKIVPIILRQNAKQLDVIRLADALKNNVDSEKTLVLASVDFSHYQPVPVANFHDQVSRAVIEQFDLGRLKSIEVDSPNSLLAVLTYLEKIGVKKSELKFSTNSGVLAPATADYTTSHNFYYFYQGNAQTPKFFSGLFFGDAMLDRNVGTKISRIGMSKLLAPIAGEEKRFLMGADVVSFNLEGAVTNKGAHYPPSNTNDFAFSPANVIEFKKIGFNYVTIANNHLSDQGQKGIEETKNNLTSIGLPFSGCADRQVGDCSVISQSYGTTKVGLIGLSMVYGDFDPDQAKKIVQTTKSANDLVVVNIHWGSEYTHQFSKKQQNIAHALIDAGADVIIGHHPHVVQGIEMYKNKPIFYSLGNFIFDQYFSVDTQESLSVGLFWDGVKWTCNLFPLKQSGSVPSLMAGKQKTNFLTKLAGWSVGSVEFKQQITKGEIKNE